MGVSTNDMLMRLGQSIPPNQARSLLQVHLILGCAGAASDFIIEGFFHAVCHSRNGLGGELHGLQ